MKKTILSAAFCLVAFSAYAQEKEETIENIELQGKFMKLPYQKISENIEIITSKEIAVSAATTIDDLLQQIPGMDIRRRGANGVQSDVSLRGSSFEQVMILLNGIRMNDSQTGHNSLNIPVDLADVERIEIVKGPAAMRYGNNAYAGVINIVTKPSSDEHVKISAEGGDFKTYNLGLSSTFGNDRISNLFQANSGASDGYRHNTDSKINNIFYQNRFKINNGNIGLQAGFSEKKFGANGFYASPAATEQYEETQSSVVAVTHSQDFGKFALNSNIYWRRGQDMYLYNREKPEIYRNMHIGNNIGGEVNGIYNSSLGTTGLGLELRKEFLASSNLGHRERFISQLFFQHHFSLVNDRLQINPGISWANFSDEGNFFYPGLDVGFDLNQKNKIYGNIARVHRIPTFTDKFYVSKTEIGNPDLKPENAVSAELGYRFLQPGFQAKLSGFIRNSNNSIDWVKVPEDALWHAMNTGKIETKGIEAEIEHRPVQWFKYFAGYTFIDLNYKQTQGDASRYISDHLKHQFIAKAEVNFLKYFTNEIAYRYLQRENGGSYNLLDEKLTITKNNFDIYLLINNLTATKHTEAFGVPMPGRWFHVGLSYEIKFKK